MTEKKDKTALKVPGVTGVGVSSTGVEAMKTAGGQGTFYGGLEVTADIKDQLTKQNVIVTDSMNIESFSADSFTVDSASALCTLTGAADVTITAPVTVSSAAAFTMGTNTLEVTGAVTMNADLEITAASTKFDSTVNGGNDLTVNGNADFEDTVGGTTAVEDLTVTGAGSFKKAVTAAGDLHVTGAATFGANVTAANILLEEYPERKIEIWIPRMLTCMHL